MTFISLPERLVKEARKKHIDLEKELVEYLIRRLNLDPRDEIILHVELAEKYLSEGKNLVEKDTVQACEKLYKAAEEAVKALTIHFDLRAILERVRERSRWTITDLSKAVHEIASRIGEWFLDAWDHAWVLHVWGFHEAKLDSEDVKARYRAIERMVKEARKYLQNAQ